MLPKTVYAQILFGIAETTVATAHYSMLTCFLLE